MIKIKMELINYFRRERVMLLELHENFQILVNNMDIYPSLIKHGGINASFAQSSCEKLKSL